MNPALDDAVELLDRALAFTRVALADVTDDALARPTPCSAWTLGRLLAHMEDALDAFTEAAAGSVRVDPPGPATDPVGVVGEKACALLGAWMRATPAVVVVGDRGLDSGLLVGTAALEITVHGWDVSQATGRTARIPEALAAGLLPIARQVVVAADRGIRFDHPRHAAECASHDIRLLAYLGRHLTGPPGRIRSESDPFRDVTS
ncbi:MAG: hypothetical protein JWO11_486 [Nocardioides sp.]|nr:hypothetical protein [Nocardioides sp.]